MPKFIMAGYYKEMNPVDLPVLMCIYEHANTVTGHCYPTQEYISQLIGVRRETVTRSMKRLDEMGFIIRVPAKIMNKYGRLEDTAHEIIVTPFNKINDEAYHRELREEIARIKYIVVSYSKGSITRGIIGTGANNDSKTAEEVNEIRQANARSAREVDEVEDNNEYSGELGAVDEFQPSNEKREAYCSQIQVKGEEEMEERHSLIVEDDCIYEQDTECTSWPTDEEWEAYCALEDKVG